MTMAALAGIDQRSVSSLSCRTTAIIASRQPQPQYHMPTRKSGKDPDYQNSQTGTSLAKEGCVGHLTAGPAAGSYPNIRQDQTGSTNHRTTVPIHTGRKPYTSFDSCQVSSREWASRCYCNATSKPVAKHYLPLRSQWHRLPGTREGPQGHASNIPSTACS